MIRVLKEEIETGSDNFYELRFAILAARIQEIDNEASKHWKRIGLRVVPQVMYDDD